MSIMIVNTGKLVEFCRAILCHQVLYEFSFENISSI